MHKVAFLALLTACKTSAEPQACAGPCDNIDTCDLSPPDTAVGGWTPATAGSCNSDCEGKAAPRLGFSECQLECLDGEACATAPDCWNPLTATFSDACLVNRSLPTPAPDQGDPTPENGTDWGSSEAGALASHPSVRVAVVDSGFDLNRGDTPANVSGRYNITGTVDNVTAGGPAGLEQAVEICLYEQDTYATGAAAQACDADGPRLEDAWITGTAEEVTVWLPYTGEGVVLLSGRVDSEGHLQEVETLVVHTHGLDVWEHGFATASYAGSCFGC